MSNPIQDALPGLLALVKGLLPFVGNDIDNAIERALTIPEAQLRKLCVGMSDADTKEAIDLGHTASDAVADFVVWLASRGTVKPD